MRDEPWTLRVFRSFILGVVPLTIATRASTNSRRAIGISVLDGLGTATVVVVFVTPLFYVLIASVLRSDRGAGLPARENAAPTRTAQVSGVTP